MIDIEELERLAKAATQGRWHVRTFDGSKWTIDDENDNPVAQAQQIKPLPVDRLQVERTANADLIAACNPAAILELLAEVRRLRAELETAKMQRFDHETAIGAITADLQSAKLLAHANGEMFRAEKAEHALLREVMREPTLTVCQFPGGASWAADGVNERVAEAAFMQCADTVTIYYGERRVFTNMAAFHNHVHARDCSKCGQKDVPANVYCKCVDCPLNPSRQSST